MTNAPGRAAGTPALSANGRGRVVDGPPRDAGAGDDDGPIGRTGMTLAGIDCAP